MSKVNKVIFAKLFLKSYSIMFSKFKIGDKAYKPKGYQFPCTIVGIFKNTKGDIRIIGEMDGYGMLHIFNENQLEKRILHIDLPKI